PFYSTNEPIEGDTPTVIWGYNVPMPWQKKGATLLRRGGTPFWDYLDAKSIPCRLYRVPANYPPSPSKYHNVKSLSGMGTTDLMGTQGVFQWFSAEFDDDVPNPDDGGKAKPMHYDAKTGRWIARLVGLPNPMLAHPPDPEMMLDIAIEPD